MTSDDSLLDKLPGGRLIAKDLSISRSSVQGNPYCRYETENKKRKYCSKSLWEDADEVYVIPQGEDIPRPLVECENCGRDTYKTDDGECGSCGIAIFDCPKCDEEVHGKQSECPHCEVAYAWNSDDDESDT